MNLYDEETSNRSHLGFTAEVVSNFSFLIKCYNFRCVEIETTFVRYESKFLFVNIYHGRRSYELGIEIGKVEKNVDTQENGYTIGEIMDLIGIRKEMKFTFFQASSKDRIQKLIPKLAEYVKSYAKPIFEGNYEVFEKLQALRTKNSDEYIKEINLRNIREAAETVWKQKDYMNLVELYNSIKDDLTSIEVKKFEYAIRMLRSE